eukprot:7297183-Prymnesium_polylepis.2
MQEWRRRRQRWQSWWCAGGVGEALFFCCERRVGAGCKFPHEEVHPKDSEHEPNSHGNTEHVEYCRDALHDGFDHDSHTADAGEQAQRPEPTKRANHLELTRVFGPADDRATQQYESTVPS